MSSSEVIAAMSEARCRTTLALAAKLSGTVYIKRATALSDYHGTGGNLAADAAFVANRFPSRNAAPPPSQSPVQ